MATDDQWKAQASALGSFIRAQRTLADLSLREMATLTKISNAYLSQVERGLHQPSVRVLSAIAEALDVPTEQLLAQAGLRRSAAAGGAGGAGGLRGAAAGAAQDPWSAATDDPTARPVAPAPGSPGATEAAIAADPLLSPEQRVALLGVYRSFTASAAVTGGAAGGDAPGAAAS